MKRARPLIQTCLAAALVAAAAQAADAQESGDGVLAKRTASVTLGPYARIEFGGASPSLGQAYWLPPGPSDPRIDFDAEALDDPLGFGAIAFGYDWQTGWRADVSLYAAGKTGIVAPCRGASDGSSCDVHADISDASVQTRGVMANVFYLPLEARGSNSVFQPFVVASLGLARNDVGPWTRENPESDRPTRVFEGDTSTGIAWSVGFGASLQVTRPGRWPVLIEAAWRYYDFGSASGGATPFPDNGSSEPRQPFTFDTTSQVVTFGVRVPLRRY